MQIAPITLLELNRQLKKLIKENKESYWIIAEISEMKENYSGHCYLELVQKDADKDQIIARSRAIIWANTFRMIKPYFETTTNQSLREGLGILVKVNVDFHEVYGLSLNITDIEPTYTVGELALRKQKIIEKLLEEGVLAMNKELELPQLCQKIAVISSATAAGYEDFADQLLNNAYGYQFYLKLFPAIMQGDEAEKSIIAALDRIYCYESLFDTVVIIRGGGSQADLSCFNNYWLAYHITQFPLPVLTGIGHEQDDSVTDLVAHTRLKTPTAVAAFLIENIADLDGKLKIVQEQLISITRERLDDSQEELAVKARNLQQLIRESVAAQSGKLTELQHSIIIAMHRSIFRKQIIVSKTESALTQLAKKTISDRQYRVEVINKLLTQALKHSIIEKKQKLNHYDDRIFHFNPGTILKRGYSITLKNGIALKDPKLLAEGDLLETLLYKGKIHSILKKK
jgi:exodeoxyribonuclease VII large subunit